MLGATVAAGAGASGELRQVDIAVGACLILGHGPKHGNSGGTEAAQQRLDLGCLLFKFSELVQRVAW